MKNLNFNLEKSQKILNNTLWNQIQRYAIKHFRAQRSFISVLRPIDTIENESQ